MNLYKDVIKHIISFVDRETWLNLRLVSKKFSLYYNEVQEEIQKKTYVYLFILEVHSMGHGEEEYRVFDKLPDEIDTGLILDGWASILNKEKYREWYSIIYVSLFDLYEKLRKEYKRQTLYV